MLLGFLLLYSTIYVLTHFHQSVQFAVCIILAYYSLYWEYFHVFCISRLFRLWRVLLMTVDLQFIFMWRCPAKRKLHFTLAIKWECKISLEKSVWPLLKTYAKLAKLKGGVFRIDCQCLGNGCKGFSERHRHFKFTAF